MRWEPNYRKDLERKENYKVVLPKCKQDLGMKLENTIRSLVFTAGEH
jgi:hypothetical protein